MLTNAMKDELIKGLLNIFADDIKAIILYGSVARNESTSESDIDIAIIMQHDMDDIKREKFIRWSADVGRILRTFKIKKNVEVTDNGKDNF